MAEYVVLKFGGSSQCKEGTQTMLNKIKQYLQENMKIIMVISAVGKTTNMLYDIVNGEYDKFNIVYDNHKKFCESINVNFDILSDIFENLRQDINDLHKPFVDILQKKIKIISYGENISSMIIHNFLINQSIENNLINAHNYIKNKNTSENINNETFNLKGEFYCDDKLLNYLTNFKDVLVFVTQGFIASTSDGKYCILTRSGSNTSASLIASLINAKRLEIWTDVCGLYTYDPRKIKNAKVIPFIKYSICQEAAAMGSQVVHPYSIRPCEKKKIPIYIKNTFDIDNVGSVINCNGPLKIKNCLNNLNPDSCNDFNEETNKIYLIACQKNVTLFEIESIDMWDGYGFVGDIFKVFNDEQIDVSIITTSQFSIMTTTSEKSQSKIINTECILKKKFDVKISKCCVVSVIADDVIHNEIIKQSFSKIPEIFNIRMMHYSSNNTTLSYVVEEDRCDDFVEILHDVYFKN